jgi:hypothetical protein
MPTQRRVPGLLLIFFAAVATSFVFAQSARAQEFKPPVTRNAALRYWIAFSLMQDPAADLRTSELLNIMAQGKSEWDEAKLGPIVDANREAILTMQRATRLPECDWGLEYDLGPETPLPPYAKARVLGNLNVMYGMRQAANHDTKGAVETWLAGVRFAKQFAQGESLLGVLIGKAMLEPNLHMLDAAALRGELDVKSRAEIATAIRAVPEYGFDWSEGWRFETYGMIVAMKQMKESPDPKRWYTRIFGEYPQAPFVVPTAEDLRKFQTLMDDITAAFRLPYPEAKERLAAIAPRIASMNPMIAATVPNASRANDARGEVQATRWKLLEDLAK